jgi:hypothetical protein
VSIGGRNSNAFGAAKGTVAAIALGHIEPGRDTQRLLQLCRW